MDELELALVDLINKYPLPFHEKKYVLKHVIKLAELEEMKFKLKESEEQQNEQMPHEPELG